VREGDARLPESGTLVRSATLVAACGLALAACSGGHNGIARKDSATRGSSASSTPAPLTPQQGSTLSTALSSGTDDGLRTAVLVPPGQQIDPQVAAQLKAAAPVTFDTSTFSGLDRTHATVRGHFAHPPPGQPSTWTFTLVWSSGAWKIVGTEQAR
jgi:hypothetical protein